MKKIKIGKSFSYYNKRKFDKMIEVKKRNKIGLTLMDDSIENYYADSGLGGGRIIMSFNADSTFCRVFYNDPRIKSIEFGLDLEPGFLSWVELWKIIDDLIREHNLDRCEILKFDIFETVYVSAKNYYIIKPDVVVC